MKKILILTCILGGYLGFSFPSQAQDTIQVDLGEKAKIWIYAKDREGLLRLRELDLNRIIREATAQIDTSQIADQEEKIYEYELNPQTQTLTLVEKAPEPVQESQSKELELTFNENSWNWKGNRVFWAIDFGLNNYLENGNFPDSQGQPYGLRSFGSRYFAFGFYTRSHLGKRRSPMSLQFGVEFSWYNFMFQEDNYIVSTEDGVEFRDYLEDFGEELDKTKLVVPYFNLPVTLNFRFRNRQGKRTFNLGVGGYVGYRLGSRSKVKFDGHPLKDRGNFFVNNWRYGLEAQVGYRNTLLFFKYDLNKLFADGKGPELNAFAFGIRI